MPEHPLTGSGAGSGTGGGFIVASRAEFVELTLQSMLLGAGAAITVVGFVQDTAEMKYGIIFGFVAGKGVGWVFARFVYPRRSAQVMPRAEPTTGPSPGT